MTDRLMTVLGPVDAGEIEFADAHNHVWIEPVDGAHPDSPVLLENDRILKELRGFRKAGGDAIVDCQPLECGRNGRRMAELSRESGVHVIGSTGFHRERYYGADAKIWQNNAGEAFDLFQTEIEDGMRETRGSETSTVHPGVIKVAAESTLEKTPQHLLSAAAKVARDTGYAVEMHTEKGAAVEDLVRFLKQEGLPLKQLIVCHVDKRPDFELHRDLVEENVMLEYDTFYRPKYNPEENLWPLLVRMIEENCADHLALATDMAQSRMWKQYGGTPGLIGFFTEIKSRLEEMGFADPIIRQLMGGNFVRRLSLSEDEQDRINMEIS